MDVLPAEDLSDLDNGALLDALDNDQNSAAHNLAEIVAESAPTTNSENDRSALEEGDPRLCQYWNADRRCRYMDEDFTEPVCNKWVGCKYTFVCPDHDTRDFFGDKVTTSSDDKHILNPVDHGGHSREETPKITSIRRAVATLFLQGKLCRVQWSNLSYY